MPDKTILLVGIAVLFSLMYNTKENFCEKKEIFVTDLSSIPTINSDENKIKYTPRIRKMSYIDNDLLINNYNTTNLSSYDIDSTMMDRAIYQGNKSKKQAIYNSDYNRNIKKLMQPYINKGIIASENMEWWQSIYE